MKRYILFNPFSGNGKIEEKVKTIFKKTSDDCVFFDITKIDYNTLLSNIREEDILIICGGDGTLNKFVNDTKNLQYNCKIYYYPTGTGNDFLHDTGYKEEDCPICIDQYIKNLPEVEIKGSSYKFINNVGYGIDGYCCVMGDKLKSKSAKPVNYTAIAIKGLLFHYKPTNATITVDGKEYKYKKVWIAPTMNGKFYGGGMMATPNQNRGGDDLSIMLFYGKGRLSTLIAFPSIFKGTHIKHKNMVAIHTGKDITVKFDEPRPVQIDGEVVPEVIEYRAKSKILISK